MLPSSQGRPSSGISDTSGDNNPLGNPYSHRSSTTFPSDHTSEVHSRRPSPSQPATATHNGAWVYQNQDRSTASYTKATPPSNMIGPASTFYNPEDVAQQQRDQLAQEQYQRWIDSYTGQQQQQQQQYHSSTYQHPPGQSIPPRRDQFDFTLPQHAFTEPSTASTAQSSLGVAASFQPQMYGSFLTTTVEANSATTHNGVPESYQQNQHRQPQHSGYASAENSLDGLLAIASTGQPQPYHNSQHNPHLSHSPSWQDHGGRNMVHSDVSTGSRPASSPTKRNLNMSARRPPDINLSTNTNGIPITKVSPRPSPPVPSARPSKRPRVDPNSAMNEPASDSDHSDDEIGVVSGGGISVGMGGLGVRGRGSKLPSKPGACTHCRKLKMKCNFPRNDNTCGRCKSGGHVCIVEGRKPRTAPNKREYLLAQIRQKDAIIENLLKQLHNPYIATPLSIASYRMATSPSDENNHQVIEWLDRLKASVATTGGKAGPKAFRLDERGQRGPGDGDDSEEESQSKTYARAFGLTPPVDEDGEDDDDGSTEGTDKLQQSALPDSHVPLGLFANLALSNRKIRKQEQGAESYPNDQNDENVGVANERYFMPGPATNLSIRAALIEQHSPPEILVHGLVQPADVDKLFEIFYERVNPFISLLDPVLHTPATTFARCPFLFTVICAISSRYYAEKSEVYPIAMHFAKHSAANALINGWKSVELCQAYILMSIFAVPARRWEDDRSWLYTGLAIRIATDLNLHQVASTKPSTEKQEREILNRTRVWMMCSNLDRSTATQFGKPFTIKEDYIMRNASDWYKKSKYNLNYDVHLCAHSALLQIVARFHDEIFSDSSSPTGLNKQVDFRTVTLAHDAHLTQYFEEWTRRFSQDSDPNDRSSAFRCTLLPFLVEYSRLVMFSFGFQQAFHRGIEPGDEVFFFKTLDAAKSVIKNMLEDLAPSGYMRYAPDGHFVFASFASAFLLKLLRPEFANLLPKDQETEIFDLIGRLIQTLSSPEIAIDDRHTPKLYARFLAGLLSRYRRDGATVGRLHPQPPPHSQASTSSEFDQTVGSAPSSSVPSPPQSQASTQGSGFVQGGFYSRQAERHDTPIYLPEATFTSGSGPIHFDLEMSSFGANGLSEEEMLATMQTLKNPAWWESMMMPGFSWPESPSPLRNSNPATPLYQQSMGIPGVHPGFGALAPAPPQVHLH